MRAVRTLGGGHARQGVPGGHHQGDAGAMGAQGTLGGTTRAVGARPGRMQFSIGDEGYLWILVALEVLSIGWLRNAFRRYHGG